MSKKEKVIFWWFLIWTGLGIAFAIYFCKPGPAHPGHWDFGLLWVPVLITLAGWVLLGRAAGEEAKRPR
jgi:hypothetical protein